MNSDALDRAWSVLGVSSPLVPDLLAAARSGGLAAESASRMYSRQLSAAAAIGMQRVVACATIGQTWAPWEVTNAVKVLALDTARMAIEGLGRELFAATWEALSAKLLEQARELIGSLIDAVTSIPVIGWVIDILVSFARVIAGLARYEREAAEAKAAANRLPAPVPDPLNDELQRLDVERVIREELDWTPLWLPEDPEGPWFDGWSCRELDVCFGVSKSGTPNNCARLVEPVGDGPWLGGYGFRGVFGGGGGQLVDRWVVLPDGRGVEATGRWSPLTASAIAAAEALVWSDGPAAFRVDAERLSTAWARWAYRWRGGERGGDSGLACPGLKPETRHALNLAVAEATGIGWKWSPDEAAERAPSVVAAEQLARRQRWLAGSTAAIYVDAATVPVYLRAAVDATQRDALGMRDVLCSVDLARVPDPVYRAELEFRRAKLGLGCDAALGLAGPGLDPGPGRGARPGRLAPGRSPEPKPPAFPALPSAARRAASRAPSPTGPRTGSDGSAGALWLLLAGGLAAYGLTRVAKRASYPRARW